MSSSPRHLSPLLRELVRDSVAVLGRVIELQAGKPTFQRVERLRREMARSRSFSAVKRGGYEVQLRALERQYEKLKGATKSEQHEVARAFTLMLELMNACENAYRSYRIRSEAVPPPTSVPQSVIYVLTAHPTEARAPEFILVFREITKVLSDILSGFDPIGNKARLDHWLKVAWQTPIVRAKKPEVRDEAAHIYSALLRRETLSALLSVSAQVAPIYLRSWVGGDKDGHPGELLRASEIGVKKEKRLDKMGFEYDFDKMVTLKDGKPVVFDPKDEKNVAEGDLLVETEISGIKVKSALQVLRDSASSKTVAQWAEVAGVEASAIEEVAKEFTSHGKKAAADIHRGVSQHTNGYYNCHAWLTLNILIGNYDWTGGMIKASTYDHAGEKAGKPFNFKKLHSLKMNPFGVDIIRANTKYEDTTLFSGYPAKRPWFPLASDIYQEIIPSAGDGYPYPLKAMILYMGSPVYALPAGHTNIKVLADVNKLPLFITSDILIGETSAYADYVFPDLTYLERWEFHGSHPTIAQKVQPVRQPAMMPMVETVKIKGQEMPICLESMIIALALELGVSGFGKDGLKDGMDLIHPDDFYLRMVANLAHGEKEDGSAMVADANAEEIAIFEEARRHLPNSVYNLKRWKKIVGDDLWPKVVYVLNRGGRFQDFAKSYEGAKVANKYGALVNMYCEKTAGTKNSMTGKKFSGIATYVPPALDCLGRPLPDEDYPLTMITYRRAWHTKSRTVSNYWLLDLEEENNFLLNPDDAKRLGIKDGEIVKVVSASNLEGVWDLQNGVKKPMEGKIKVTEGIRPGVTAFYLGMGHWAYGASDVVVDGKTIKGDPRRGKGVHANAAIRVDPHLGNVCLSDMIGASAVFYDTRVKLVKA